MVVITSPRVNIRYSIFRVIPDVSKGENNKASTLNMKY